jgi:heme A synthase
MNSLPFAAGLHRYAIAVAVCTFTLVLAGAAMVSKEGRMEAAAAAGPSALSDLHHLLGALCGLLALILMTWLQRTNEPNWLKRLALGVLVLIGAQGAIGILGFTGMVSGAVSIPHAVLAHVLFSLTALMAVLTSQSWKEPPARIPDGGSPSLRSLAWVAPLAVLVQIGLGAAYRHKALGLVPHVAWAFAAAVVVMAAATFVLVHDRKHVGMCRSAVFLLLLAPTQILAGVAAYFTRARFEENPETWMWMMAGTVAHTGLGALVLASSVILSALTLRHIEAPEEGVRAPGSARAGNGRGR